MCHDFVELANLIEQVYIILVCCVDVIKAENDDAMRRVYECFSLYNLRRFSTLVLSF